MTILLLIPWVGEKEELEQNLSPTDQRDHQEKRENNLQLTLDLLLVQTTKGNLRKDQEILQQKTQIQDLDVGHQGEMINHVIMMPVVMNLDVGHQEVETVKAEVEEEEEIVGVDVVVTEGAVIEDHRKKAKEVVEEMAGEEAQQKESEVLSI